MARRDREGEKKTRYELEAEMLDALELKQKLEYENRILLEEENRKEAEREKKFYADLKARKDLNRK
jgi:hypothetical protein